MPQLCGGDGSNTAPLRSAHFATRRRERAWREKRDLGYCAGEPVRSGPDKPNGRGVGDVLARLIGSGCRMG